MVTIPEPLRMPGSTLITRLKVYDTAAPDGQRGGTPHVHLLCSELYFVLSGQGEVEIIDSKGFARIELRQNDAFLFSPGTIHRLINPHGDLHLLITMQNSGLPERGDNVVTFDESIMGDEDRFTDAMRVTTFDDVMRRRDAGVYGFLALKAAFEQDVEQGRAALSQFYRHAVARADKHYPEWAVVITGGAMQDSTQSFARAADLMTGGGDHLYQAAHVLMPGGGVEKFGFCGIITRYFDPATLAIRFQPEGERQ